MDGYVVENNVNASGVETYAISSPDGELELTFFLRDGAPFYALKRRNAPFLKTSRLGLRLAQGANLEGGFTKATFLEDQKDETWQQPWGEDRVIEDKHQELLVCLKGQGDAQLNIRFRVFNDGFGFRYEAPKQGEQKTVRVTEELSSFSFEDDWDAWWIKANQPNSYELLYRRTPLAEVDEVHTPLTLRRQDGVHACIHEAAIFSYPTSAMQGDGAHTLQASPIAWSDGDLAKTEFPFNTPWRIMIIADTAAGICDSRIVLNLAEPSRLTDTDWLKPGKFIGVWWEMHRQLSTWGSGPHHAATTENTKRYIDFAAKHGIESVLVEGWNQGWDGNWTKNRNSFSFTEAYPDFDLDYLLAYARSKDVDIVLQNETAGGVPNYESQMETAYDMYSEKGVLGVKTGHVAFGRDIERRDEDGDIQKELHGGQYMVDYLHRTLERAADRKLMIDMHEPVLSGGLRRTYPHLMSIEGARGQEYNAWDKEGGNPPNHVTHLPFTRMIDGPFDYTPGIVDLLYESSASGTGVGASIHENEGASDLTDQSNRVQHTLAKELALYVVLHSGWQMVCDLPENYEKTPAFKFIKDVPADWEKSWTADGAVGEYIVSVRQARAKDEFYIGAMTNETPRTLFLALSFLEEGDYVAEIYKDGSGADWDTNPLSIDISSIEVSSETTLKLDLAPGGGQAIRIVRASK